MMTRIPYLLSTFLLLCLIVVACGPSNVTEQPDNNYPKPPQSADANLTIRGKVDESDGGWAFAPQAKRLRAYMYSSQAVGAGTFGQVIEGTFDPESGEFQAELPATIPDDLLSKDFESFCQEGSAELNISTKNLRVSYFSELNLEDPDDDDGLVLEDGEQYFGYIVLLGPNMSGMGHWFYSNAPARVTGTCTYFDPWANKAFNLNLKAGWNYVVAEGNGEGLTTYTSVATLPNFFLWYYILSV